MGGDNVKMERQIKALRNFKKYEDLFYSYLDKRSMNNEDLEFFLVPKDYIISFCKSFNYRSNIKELINLNVYHDSQMKNDENYIIEKDLINNLTLQNREIIEANLQLNKINNSSIIENKDASKYSFKLNQEGLFIPLLYNIWDKFNRYYGCDITLKRKGFSNNGELFVLSEEKRIDSFFKNIKTRDVIYHFCFKMEEKKNFDKLKNYFKMYSAKDLVERLGIKYVGNVNKDKRFIEIKIKIPPHISIIGGYLVTIYFLDSYIFKENRESETISFEVEKGLKKPYNYYETIEKDLIIKSIFKIKEPMEVLMSNFNTDENKFFNSEKKSLIQGLILAYKNHYPIVISPDMIWILILQGYSRFMDKYSELVREKYVNFEGKKTLNVKRIGIFPKEASKETWQEIIDDFIKGIKYYVGGEVIENLQSDFTTTEEVTLATSQMTIMSAMKNYFNFELGMGGCGISSIILEGTIEDWEKIKSKLVFFSNKSYGLSWWTKHLIPIIDKIIVTKNYYSKEKKINDEIQKFWKDMVRIKKGKDEYYDPFIINGWIIKFIPNFSENKPKLFDEMKKEDIPDQILNCPLKLTVYNMDMTKTIHNCYLASGFYGMTQNKKNYSIRPVIGYALISGSKNNYPMTEKELSDFINENNNSINLLFNNH